MRTAARTDNNHKQIVSALREIGCSVLSLAALGKGVPDLLVARNGRSWLIEIKDGSKSPSKRKLNQDQINFKATWRGQWAVAETVQEAIEIVMRNG
jgi:Holliday junction resolvase